MDANVLGDDIGHLLNRFSHLLNGRERARGRSRECLRASAPTLATDRGRYSGGDSGAPGRGESGLQPRADALQPHALDVRSLLVAEDLDDGAVDLLKKADAR